MCFVCVTTAHDRSYWTLRMGDILLASDEENEGSSHAQGIARGLPPAHRHVEIQTLLGRPCRCNRATCFQQFAGQEQQVSAKRSEFTSLSPEDRALCLQQQVFPIKIHKDI